MAGRKSDFTLTKLDDLFSTQEQRDEEKLSKIRDIPLTEIDDFPDHPFKVRDDEDSNGQLVEVLILVNQSDKTISVLFVLFITPDSLFQSRDFSGKLGLFLFVLSVQSGVSAVGQLS